MRQSLGIGRFLQSVKMFLKVSVQNDSGVQGLVRLPNMPLLILLSILKKKKKKLSPSPHLAIILQYELVLMSLLSLE